MKKIIGFLMLGLALCAAAWAACEEAADVAERAQKRLSSAQSKLNDDPNNPKAQDERMAAWNAWREAKEKLAVCVQKNADSSWR